MWHCVLVVVRCSEEDGYMPVSGLNDALARAYTQLVADYAVRVIVEVMT